MINPLIKNSILSLDAFRNDGEERQDCNMIFFALLVDKSVWECTDTDRIWKKIA